MTPELLLLLLLLSLEGVEFCLARKDDGDEDEREICAEEGEGGEDEKMESEDRRRMWRIRMSKFRRRGR